MGRLLLIPQTVDEEINEKIFFLQKFFSSIPDVSVSTKQFFRDIFFGSEKKFGRKYYRKFFFDLRPKKVR